MTFLAPALLFALPLATLPVIIHLIHLYRRRQVKWAAMMFLHAAQRMNKGLSRLKQILILLLRALAVAAILLVIARPLAGGWLGLTGGAPDTVIVLLDRSASMEQTAAHTGVSKRAAGLRNLAKAIHDAVGTRSRLVLIDSALRRRLILAKPEVLPDFPQTEATDTSADIPALLQSALDYIIANKTGRTDLWLLSDLQAGDWDASGGRWEALRGAFRTLQGVRFHLLTYPQAAEDDLGVTVERVTRREGSDRAELLLDLIINRRHPTGSQPIDVPVRFVINGTATAAKLQVKEGALTLQGYSLPIDKATKRGWGRVELPADTWAADNTFNFVFAEPPVMRSVVVSDDEAESAPLVAALSSAAGPDRQYQSSALPVRRAAEIAWAETALIVWQAPIPKTEDPLGKQLRDHVAAGRTLLFLPPDAPDGTDFRGVHWTAWTGRANATDKAQTVDWWRNDAGLLANTRDGLALPVGTLEIVRRCAIAGDGVPLARLAGREPLLLRCPSNGSTDGTAYFLGTLTGAGSSGLARDGVVMYALLHRALAEGARSLDKAQVRPAGLGTLGADPGKWHPIDGQTGAALGENQGLHAGVFADGDRLAALNRPPAEDTGQALSTRTLDELFAGLDFRVHTDTLEDSRSLTNEVWRTFLMVMALCVAGEALLCMPPRRDPAAVRATSTPLAANA